MKNSQEQTCVVLFKNSTDAMMMSRAAGEAGLPGGLIPTPRRLSKSCGMSWAAAGLYQRAIAQFLQDQRISYERLEVI